VESTVNTSGVLTSSTTFTTAMDSKANGNRLKDSSSTSQLLATTELMCGE